MSLVFFWNTGKGGKGTGSLLVFALEQLPFAWPPAVIASVQYVIVSVQMGFAWLRVSIAFMQMPFVWTDFVIVKLI